LRLFKHPLTPANTRRFQEVFQHRDELNLATGRAVLGKISARTGGNEFEATPDRPVSLIYEAITDELRNQYRIGLSCGADGCKPGYHSLLLTTRTSGETVQSRQGFYSGGEWEALLAAARSQAMKQHDSPVSFVAEHCEWWAKPISGSSVWNWQISFEVSRCKSSSRLPRHRPCGNFIS